MKAKITQGNSFRGCLDYCMDKNKNHEKILSNMDGQTARELSAEFKTVRQLRPELKNPVWHCSLSLSQGEKISSEKWAEIARDHMKNMKFDPDQNMYSVIRHNDTDYDHVHIVASKINLNGERWKDGRDVYRAITSTQQLENEHNLEKTAGLENQRKEKKPLSRNELKMAERNFKAGKKKVPPKMAIQRAIDNSLKKNPDTKIFFDDLKQQNISIKINQAKTTGRVSGISFEKDGIAFKGSKLGKGYSWKGIQERGLNYEQKRDRETIERRNEAHGRADGRNNQNTKGNSSRESTESNRQHNDRTIKRDQATIDSNSRSDKGLKRDSKKLKDSTRVDQRAFNLDKPHRGFSSRIGKQMEKGSDDRRDDQHHNDGQHSWNKPDDLQHRAVQGKNMDRKSVEKLNEQTIQTTERWKKGLKARNEAIKNRPLTDDETFKRRQKKREQGLIQEREATQKQEQKKSKSKTKITLNDPKYVDLKKLRDEFFLLKKQKPKMSEAKKIHETKLKELEGALRKEISRINSQVEAQHTKKEQELTRGRASAGESVRQRREREKTNSRGFSRGR